MINNLWHIYIDFILEVVLDTFPFSEFNPWAIFADTSVHLVSFAVCEERHYHEPPTTEVEEEFGRTIFIEESAVVKTIVLYKPDGEKV